MTKEDIKLMLSELTAELDKPKWEWSDDNMMIFTTKYLVHFRLLENLRRPTDRCGYDVYKDRQHAALGDDTAVYRESFAREPYRGQKYE